jgi:hypothetical protein
VSNTRRMLPMLAVLLLSTVPSAQERRQGGPPPYDPKTEVTMSGTVVGLETITPGDRPEQMILILTVDDAPLAVFVGPSAWVSKQRFAFTKGATAEVVGMKGFRYDGKAAVTPRMVKIGAKTLTIRDAAGKPAWETETPDQR